MVKTQTKVMVMGAGGMGALFGMILDEGGMDVTLVDHDEAHVAAIQKKMAMWHNCVSRLKKSKRKKR